MPGESVWSLIGMLAAVLAILALAYWTTRAVGRHGGGIPGGAGERLRVLCRLSLGRDGALVLVRLQERCLLLGVTEHGVTLLKELEGDEAAEWLAEPEKSAPPSFMEILRENLGKRK